ncbi:PREDICTED: putative odorant receptor 92a [Cyphomyrmex costatus]|uniref:putative odorant receptor 92a n=1 Tax=Cyphomyrmex costatus TaxID=456900 RepID=UPI00085239CD|nr:PREDICTED: putative odorant receptor 92a [Cyphomyrmex costatus]
MTMFAVDYKILHLFVNHESFAELIKDITEGMFKPLLLVEIEIRRKFDKMIQFAYATNKRFTRIIAFQFVASTFVVCSNLYQLTRTKLIMDFIAFFSYTICVLVQIFIYCWFGNKLKLKSLQLVNSIFEIEWIALDHKTKMSLLIIMTRAMKPIEFNSAYILNMNLDSFVALLKTSYSAYNLLAQLQE